MRFIYIPDDDGGYWMIDYLETEFLFLYSGSPAIGPNKLSSEFVFSEYINGIAGNGSNLIAAEFFFLQTGYYITGGITGGNQLSGWLGL